MKARRSFFFVGTVLAAFTCIAAFVFACISKGRFDLPSLYNDLSPLITKDVELELRWAEYASGLEQALTRVSSTWLLLD